MRIKCNFRGLTMSYFEIFCLIKNTAQNVYQIVLVNEKFVLIKLNKSAVVTLLNKKNSCFFYVFFGAKFEKLFYGFVKFVHQIYINFVRLNSIN